MNVPLWAWFAVLGIILLMLAIDLFAHRKAHVISVREAAVWSSVWVALGVAFGAILWYLYGGEIAGQYFSGYVIEKSLAVDNVFVWALIFSYFAVPREYQHRVLFLGVIGALVMRGAFIALGAVLIANLSFIVYVFGAFLIFTGYKMFRSRNEHYDVGKSRLVTWFRRKVPHTDDYAGGKMWVRRNGVWLATPLLLVLLLVEFTDLIFAVDSIPAIFAVTQEPFLVFTANAFAILGLRAMYFLLADLMHRFIYLTTGLSIVLVWVGVKMVLLGFDIKIPTLLSLAVVVVVIAISVVMSLRATAGLAPTASAGADPAPGPEGQTEPNPAAIGSHDHATDDRAADAHAADEKMTDEHRISELPGERSR